MSVSNVYETIIKSIEHVKTVTSISVSALLLNIVLNAAFIFGWGFFPKLEEEGVAWATTISRVIEFITCLIVGSRVKELNLNFKCMFRKNALLFKDFIHYTLPALGNEFIVLLKETSISGYIGIRDLTRGGDLTALFSAILVKIL